MIWSWFHAKDFILALGVTDLFTIVPTCRFVQEKALHCKGDQTIKSQCLREKDFFKPVSPYVPVEHDVVVVPRTGFHSSAWGY